MKTNRMSESRVPRAAAEPRRRPPDSVFRNFVRTLEKLESARRGGWIPALRFAAAGMTGGRTWRPEQPARRSSSRHLSPA